jgi:hypothetical protein
MWGVPTSLKEKRNGKWETVYQWETWAGEKAISEPFPAPKTNRSYSSGFGGEASFKIRIPDLAPGEYRITKRFSTGPNDRDDTTRDDTTRDDTTRDDTTLVIEISVVS